MSCPVCTVRPPGRRTLRGAPGEPDVHAGRPYPAQGWPRRLGGKDNWLGARGSRLGGRSG